MRLSTSEDSAWEQKEAAILALGAVAEGCISGLLPHLAQVIWLCRGDGVILVEVVVSTLGPLVSGRSFCLV